MKSFESLYINNNNNNKYNKLKTLDKAINYLGQFKFMKSLNLFGNQATEEPEYRPKIIDTLKSLEIFCHHMVFAIKKIKAEKVVKEYNNPLS